MDIHLAFRFLGKIMQGFAGKSRTFFMSFAFL